MVLENPSHVSPTMCGYPWCPDVFKGPALFLAPTLDPSTPAGKGADLGTVLGACHRLDELQGGLAWSPHPNQGTEPAQRTRAWRNETQAVRVGGDRPPGEWPELGTWGAGRGGGFGEGLGRTLGLRLGQTWGKLMRELQVVPSLGHSPCCRW